MSAPYIPDVGDTFDVTDVWTYRRWSWKPFPWRHRRVITDTASYRVDSWLKRRPPRPEPRNEREALTRTIFDQMIADGRMEGPRVAGPDQVPLAWCLREEAEYVSGTGICGTIQRVADITVTGRVAWDEKTIASYRWHAEQLAGEPLT